MSTLVPAILMSFLSAPREVKWQERCVYCNAIIGDDQSRCGMCGRKKRK